ncbi:cell wall biogenesis protein, partial [Rhizoclosmatium hyalinum]
AANTYLPGSNKRVDLHIETIMLFWKFYEINEHFATLVKDSDLILPFTSTLLYFMIETKSSPNDIGLTRMSTFLLHILSQERTYAVHLNAPFDSTPYQAVTRHLPIFQGTWADFVTLALHHLITTTAKTPVATLHETMLMVLANMAPYFKCLCVVSCNKLMSLLKVFVNPAFLVSKEANHKCVFYLVDLCNGVVQYQVAGEEGGAGGVF